MWRADRCAEERRRDCRLSRVQSRIGLFKHALVGSETPTGAPKDEFPAHCSACCAGVEHARHFSLSKRARKRSGHRGHRHLPPSCLWRALEPCPRAALVAPSARSLPRTGIWVKRRRTRSRRWRRSPRRAGAAAQAKVRARSGGARTATAACGVAHRRSPLSLLCNVLFLLQSLWSRTKRTTSQKRRMRRGRASSLRRGAAASPTMAARRGWVEVPPRSGRGVEGRGPRAWW